MPLAIEQWRPPPLVGQVVLVTTCNEDGTSNIAPKCWAMMIASTPPTLSFNCNLEHWTSRNVLKSHEFVINVPGVEIAQLVWNTYPLPHPRPVEAAGLTPIPSNRVRPPRVAECRAHLECVLERNLIYGREVVLIGQIVSASVDEELATCEDPFAMFKSFVYTAPGTYAVIGNSTTLR